MLNSLNEGLHHAVTFDEFKNIIKIRRRNMSACRQSIDENKGAHRKLPICTTFKAPVLMEDEGAANIAARAAARVQTMKRSQRLEAKAKRKAKRLLGSLDEEVDQVVAEPTLSARRSAIEEAEEREERMREEAEDAAANKRMQESTRTLHALDSGEGERVQEMDAGGGIDGNLPRGINIRPTESTANNALHLPPLNLPKGADTI